MFQDRMESYRYSFGKPPEIRLEIQRENEVQRRIFGLLLDVSPGGAKIFSEHELPVGAVAVKFFFKINHENIAASGELVWKSAISNGWVYGVEYFADSAKEMLIAEEIKARIAII